MKAFSTLCALSLATLIAAPLAAQAADDCNANGHEQHQKASHDDCGKHAGEGRKEHGDAREPGKGPGEHHGKGQGDEGHGPGKGQGDHRDEARGPGKGQGDDRRGPADKSQQPKPDEAHRPAPDSDDDKPQD